MLGAFLFLLASIQTIDANTFPKKPGTWTYQGSLIDPMNGQTIAKIVGLELFHSVPDPKSSDCECFVSRKLFCYTDKDQKTPLDYYRRRFNGPKRRIPLSQSVVSSDALVRYYGQYISTEFDTGKSVLGKIEPTESNTSSSLKVFTTPTRGPIRTEDLSNAHHGDTSSASTTPRRHSWIQFGTMGTQPQRGVRETYDYRNDKVLYTRYGEGPVWYGPGRMAQLELTGQHYEAPRDVPIPDALQDYIPKDFWQIPEQESLASFAKHKKSIERSWWTRLRAATQFTVGERQSFDRH